MMHLYLSMVFRELNIYGYFILFLVHSLRRTINNLFKLETARSIEKAKKLTKECPNCGKMFEKNWKLQRHMKVMLISIYLPEFLSI